MKLKKNKFWLNYIAEINKDYYVSFNPNPAVMFWNNWPETAFSTPQKFYIVEADLRKELEKINTLEEVFELFCKYPEWEWSNLSQEQLIEIKNKLFNN